MSHKRIELHELNRYNVRRVITDAARLGYSRREKNCTLLSQFAEIQFSVGRQNIKAGCTKIANVSQFWKDFMELYQMGVCHCSIYPIQLQLHLLQQSLSSMGCFSETSEPAFWHSPLRNKKKWYSRWNSIRQKLPLEDISWKSHRKHKKNLSILICILYLTIVTEYFIANTHKLNFDSSYPLHYNL